MKWEHRRHWEFCATPPGSTFRPYSCLHGQNNDESERVSINSILVVYNLICSFNYSFLYNFPAKTTFKSKSKLNSRLNTEMKHEIVSLASYYFYKTPASLCFPQIILCSFLWKFPFTKNCYLSNIYLIFWRRSLL